MNQMPYKRKQLPSVGVSPRAEVGIERNHGVLQGIRQRGGVANNAGRPEKVAFLGGTIVHGMFFAQCMVGMNV